MGKAAGAIHHRFGIGDGFVAVIDEWESVEHFQKFFSNPGPASHRGRSGRRKDGGPAEKPVSCPAGPAGGESR